ncbi:hypothetical protein D3C76_1798260 [compost metagenome]
MCHTEFTLRSDLGEADRQRMRLIGDPYRTKRTIKLFFHFIHIGQGQLVTAQNHLFRDTLLLIQNIQCIADRFLPSRRTGECAR